MSKEKFTLQDLKVKSFVTSLDEQGLGAVKGGYSIKGRRYNYRVRWTSVDTRVETAQGTNTGG
ncbi:MAG: pinensin family lanthipeptide [Saprospiraceae bacterium]|jgi:hypothetical protein